MKRAVRVFIPYFLVFLFLFCFSFDIYAVSNKKTTVDYNKQTMTVAVLKIKEQYFVPLNDIITAWGGSTLLDKKTNMMTAVVGKLKMTVRNGTLTAKINEKSYKMKSAASYRNGTMYVPLDLFTNALGISATLNDSKSSVLLNFKEKLPDNQPVVPSVPAVKPKFAYSINFRGFFNTNSKNVDPSLDAGILLSSQFNKSTAQYIYYYGDIKARNLAVSVNMPITFKYYKKDGSLFQTISSAMLLEKGFTGGKFWWGFGYSRSGGWPVDTYKVDIYFWDDLVDSQYFGIFSLKPGDKAGTETKAPAGEQNAAANSNDSDNTSKDIPASTEMWKGIWVKEADLRNPVAGIMVHGFRFYDNGRIEDVMLDYGYMNEIYDKAGNLLPPGKITLGFQNGYYSIQPGSVIIYQKDPQDLAQSGFKGEFKREGNGFSYDGDKTSNSSILKNVKANGKYVKFPDNLITKEATEQ